MDPGVDTVFVVVMLKLLAVLVPQEFPAVTVIVPLAFPEVTVIDVVPCPDVIDQPPPDIPQV